MQDLLIAYRITCLTRFENIATTPHSKWTRKKFAYRDSNTFCMRASGVL